MPVASSQRSRSSLEPFLPNDIRRLASAMLAPAPSSVTVSEPVSAGPAGSFRDVGTVSGCGAGTRGSPADSPSEDGAATLHLRRGTPCIICAVCKTVLHKYIHRATLLERTMRERKGGGRAARRPQGRIEPVVSGECGGPSLNAGHRRAHRRFDAKYRPRFHCDNHDLSRRDHQIRHSTDWSSGSDTGRTACVDLRGAQGVADVSPCTDRSWPVALG